MATFVVVCPDVACLVAGAIRRPDVPVLGADRAWARVVVPSAFEPGTFKTVPGRTRRGFEILL